MAPCVVPPLCWAALIPEHLRACLTFCRHQHGSRSRVCPLLHTTKYIGVQLPCCAETNPFLLHQSATNENPLCSTTSTALPPPPPDAVPLCTLLSAPCLPRIVPWVPCGTALRPSPPFAVLSCVVLWPLCWCLPPHSSTAVIIFLRPAAIQGPVTFVCLAKCTVPLGEALDRVLPAYAQALAALAAAGVRAGLAVPLGRPGGGRPLGSAPRDLCVACHVHQALQQQHTLPAS